MNNGDFKYCSLRFFFVTVTSTAWTRTMCTETTSWLLERPSNISGSLPFWMPKIWRLARFPIDCRFSPTSRNFTKLLEVSLFARIAISSLSVENASIKVREKKSNIYFKRRLFRHLVAWRVNPDALKDLIHSSFHPLLSRRYIKSSWWNWK